jgi:glycosyltransferase involved in cell wall biosynthesis
MRIVLDLQACQSAGSRFRGIGRYSRSLAEAMLRAGRGHAFRIVLNGGLPGTIEGVRAAFDGLLPQDDIVVWENPFPAVEHLAADPWRNRVAEVVREDFLCALQPDLVHVCSLFEGWDDGVATSIGRGSRPAPPTAVTLYDLIPLAMPQQYLQDPPTRHWYERKLEDLRRADLCLGISGFSRRQGMELLGLRGEAVANISGACDPHFRVLPADSARDAAMRARYGLRRPFVMYTGGFDPRKNVDGLIRAYAALPDALRAAHQLLVVGAPPAPIAAELAAVARGCGLGPDDVRFAGFVPDPDLVALYNACALYVFPSRCEGFGLPALEAMACGAPVIGADDSSLPEVMGYPDAMFDPLDDAAMTARIRRALEDPADRALLRAHGRERVGLFSWDATAARALDAMEAMHAANAGKAATATRARAERKDDDATRMATIATQSRALGRLVAGRELPPEAARRFAQVQSANHAPPARKPQLLVDVSNLAVRDAGTGIQRVVRNVLRELLAAPPAGFDVAPVAFDEAGVLHYARGLAHRLGGAAGAPPPDPVADPRQGDVFLGLDLSAHIVPGERAQFARWRDAGVRLYFVVYDLIPLLRPDVVDPAALPHFDRWYPAIGELADGLCCISRAVVDELHAWCDQARPARERPLHIGHFHLGAELDAVPGGPGADDAGDVAAVADERPKFLMVGTLEPRKGHAQALDAFERLWAEGVDVELAIVGQPGWLMDAFAQRLRAHPEHGRRLQWFERASDADLLALYRGSAALLLASEAEGFGLPLIEAARHGLPLVARDLPVFREVAGAHATYFSGHAPQDLAAALRAWLAARRRGDVAQPAGMPWIDWRESARQLLACVLDGGWDATWRPGARYRFPANDGRIQHQVGARERAAWRSDGRAGFLSYGPYAHLPAGRYELQVQVEQLEQAGSAWFDVVVDQGRTRLLHMPVVHPSPEGSGPGDAPLRATLQLDADADDLELRLWVDDAASLRLHGFELVRAPAPG